MRLTIQIVIKVALSFLLLFNAIVVTGQTPGNNMNTPIPIKDLRVAISERYQAVYGVPINWKAGTINCEYCQNQTDTCLNNKDMYINHSVHEMREKLYTKATPVGQGTSNSNLCLYEYFYNTEPGEYPDKGLTPVIPYNDVYDFNDQITHPGPQDGGARQKLNAIVCMLKQMKTLNVTLALESDLTVHYSYYDQHTTACMPGLPFDELCDVCKRIIRFDKWSEDSVTYPACIDRPRVANSFTFYRQALSALYDEKAQNPEISAFIARGSSDWVTGSVGLKSNMVKGTSKMFVSVTSFGNTLGPLPHRLTLSPKSQVLATFQHSENSGTTARVELDSKRPLLECPFSGGFSASLNCILFRGAYSDAAWMGALSLDDLNCDCEPDESGGGSCSTCSQKGVAASPAFGDTLLSLDLGNVNYGKGSNGKLNYTLNPINIISPENFTADISQPETISSSTFAVETNTSGFISQINAPVGTFKIEHHPETNNTISVKRYSSNANPNESPQSVLTISLTGVGTDVNPLCLTIDDTGNSKRNRFIYDSNENKWRQKVVLGPQEENGGERFTTTQNISESEYKTITAVLNSEGTTISQTATTYEKQTQGGFKPVLVETGCGADVETKSMSYYESGKLKTVQENDGSWTYYEYDTEGFTTRIVRPYGDNTFTLADFNSDVSNVTSCSEEITTRDDPASDNLGYHVRTEISKIKGCEVSRTIHISDFNGSQEYRCLMYGLTYDSLGLTSNSLCKRELLYCSDSETSFIANGRPARSLSADGILTTYEYSFDDTTFPGERMFKTVEKTGSSSIPGDITGEVRVGTESVTWIDSQGKTRRTETYELGFAGIGTRALVAKTEIVTTSMENGEVVTTTYLDGTSETEITGCCGAAKERTSRDGVKTTYAYDLAGRLATEAVGEIATRSTYDAAGRIVARHRIGADQTETTLSLSAYNTVGDLISETDARGGITTYKKGINNALRFRCTTFPNGGITTTSYNIDGTIHSTESNAGAAQCYFGYAVYNGGKVVYDGLSPTTADYSTTTYDMLGRIVRTQQFQNNQLISQSSSSYNDKGQIEKTIAPPSAASGVGVIQLFGYDDRGRQTTTAINMDQNEAIDKAGVDRITETEQSVISYADPARFNDSNPRTFMRSATYRYDTDNSAARTLVSMSDVCVNARVTSQTIPGQGMTITMEDISVADQRKITTVLNPDGTMQKTIFVNGRIMTSENKVAANMTNFQKTNYEYDVYGRLWRKCTGNEGVQYSYDQADAVLTMTRLTGSGEANTWSPETVCEQYTYDNAGNMTTVTHRDDSSTSYVYDSARRPISISGAGEYTRTMGYDNQGHQTSLTVEYGSNATPATTNWVYDSFGRLVSKTDPSTSILYTYYPSGAIKSRTCGDVTTNYAYNNAGELVQTTYSDGRTPTVSITYNRAGQVQSRTDALGVTEMEYDLFGRPTKESLNKDIVLTRGYDNCGRIVQKSFVNGEPALGADVAYTYSPAGYLGSVRDLRDPSLKRFALSFIPERGSVYTEVNDTRLLKTSFVNSSGSTWQNKTGFLYDNWGRIATITSQSLENMPTENIASYTYDRLDRRTQMQIQNNQYGWHFGYNTLNEVTSAQKKNSSSQNVPGTFSHFEFDGIGNRLSEVHEARNTTYTIVSGNRYSSRSVAPRGVDVLGESDATTVTVNGSVVSERLGSLFFTALTTPGSVVTMQEVVIRAEKLVNNQIRAVEEIAKHFVSPNPENFTYDEAGNMTGDGRWQYTWDGENRLTSMSTGSVTVSFVYDGLGRRVSKTVTGLETPVSIHYYWDGWELLADDSPGNGYLRTYLWNPAHPRGYRTLLGYRDDAESNKMAMQIATTDANGSVLYMTDSTTGTVAAQFEYGPFGESLRATGVKAAACPIRYSSEYWDAETELYYYGMRYYSPRLGRWLTRDPIQEQGGLNLYNFTNNNPINLYDVLGLEPITTILVRRKSVSIWGILKYDIFKRPTPVGVDTYGHWWIELVPENESYGWWPIKPVDFFETMLSVEGQLNGTGANANPTQDSHHGGDEKTTTYIPWRNVGLFKSKKLNYGDGKGTSCCQASDDQMRSCIKDFASKYHKRWFWGMPIGKRWGYPFSKNCHAFQSSALSACCLKINEIEAKP